jgi:hypothetical protein
LPLLARPSLRRVRQPHHHKPWETACPRCRELVSRIMIPKKPTKILNMSDLFRREIENDQRFRHSVNS